MFREHRKTHLLILLWNSMILFSLAAHLMVKTFRDMEKEKLKERFELKPWASYVTGYIELFLSLRCNLRETAICLLKIESTCFGCCPYRLSGTAPEWYSPWSSGNEFKELILLYEQKSGLVEECWELWLIRKRIFTAGFRM